MTALSKIEGIGPSYAEKLKKAGIKSIEALLEAGATAKGRKELAEKTGIGDTLILNWVNRADLFRVPSVGEQYSDLLEKAGVDTVVELAKRKPENLLAKMAEVNVEKNLVNRLPTLKTVEGWVSTAKELPRKVKY
jgi:predicted flap endonuclease-1-like 5' DNA nuclease